MRWIRDHLDYQEDWCLIWPFGRTSHGYGTIRRDDKQMGAHRYICELVHGAAPDGHQAAHSCGRGADGCVNPRHLCWKTPSENQHDRTDMRHRAKRKLTAEAVDDIRACAGRENCTVTAERHNISDAAVRQIQAGKLYRSDRRVERVFTEAEVHRIRRARSERGASSALAREFGVSHTIIYNIQKGKSYAYIPPETAPAIRNGERDERRKE